MQPFKRIFRLIGIMCLPVLLVAAGGDDYSIKAKMLAAFSSHVDWPESISPKNTGRLTICVMGDDPFGTSLTEMDGRTAGNIRLGIMRDVNLDTAANCHILYISRSEDYKLGEITKKLKSLPILTVSDIRNFHNLRGMIAFELNDRKVVFKINNKNASQAGLRINAGLLDAASEVLK